MRTPGPGSVSSVGEAVVWEEDGARVGRGGLVAPFGSFRASAKLPWHGASSEGGDLEVEQRERDASGKLLEGQRRPRVAPAEIPASVMPQDSGSGARGVGAAS